MHTLEGGMRRTLAKILAATVGATLVTYLIAGAVFFLVEDRYIQPANYSELQVENVEVLTRDKSTVLLNASAAPLLDAAVGDSALKYQVVDAEGRTLYGTYAPENVELDGEMLLQEVNTAHGEGAYYVHTVPILDDENRLVGAVRCAYDFDLRFTRTTAVAKLATVFFCGGAGLAFALAGFFQLVLFAALCGADPHAAGAFARCGGPRSRRGIWISRSIIRRTTSWASSARRLMRCARIWAIRWRGSGGWKRNGARWWRRWRMI